MCGCSIMGMRNLAKIERAGSIPATRSDEIRNLRMEGLSIKQIATKLGISKSTASKWSKGLRPNNPRFSDNEQRQKASEASKNKWDILKQIVIKSAIDEWPKIRVDPIAMSFINLYWAEGDKGKRRAIRIANTDPKLIKFCYNFLRQWFKRPAHAEIRIYPDQNHEELMKFWKDILPEVNVKTIRIENRDKRIRKPNKKNKFGVCYFCVCDWELYLKVITWIACWKKEI